ncbi:hypothetical protein OUZ56_004213 [Daphnia magna]|uniref:Uncharacterized protein n=1 Tax=Daphnia magna TaxID=35525 RepID=A0ABQ9YP81_9CRUS|nr:hypothetical protein OUZ56_004213 [Daphnia magna]
MKFEVVSSESQLKKIKNKAFVTIRIAFAKSVSKYRVQSELGNFIANFWVVVFKSWNSPRTKSHSRKNGTDKLHSREIFNGQASRNKIAIQITIKGSNLFVREIKVSTFRVDEL